MSQLVTITLATAGLGTGPFDLYVDSDGYTTPVATAVPKTSLTSGYAVYVPDSAITVRVISTNATCSNYVDVAIPYPLFRSTWITTVPIESVTLPLSSNGTYAFYVNWGDGSEDFINDPFQLETTHRYQFAGTHNISIRGIIQGIGWAISAGETQIQSIEEWGPVRLGNDGSYFAECINLDLSGVIDVLDLTGTTNFNNAFYNCQALTTIANVGSWRTSQITDMSYAFAECLLFNDDLSGWNTYAATNMSYMFFNADLFDGNITTWNTHRVTDMSYMFSGALHFNQAIGNWITDNVTDMSYMFQSATLFNQSIDNWRIRKVTNMSYMFSSALNFNQPLANWEIVGSSLHTVTTMQGMFYNAAAFNQPIGNWLVDRVVDMSYMFRGATVFNQSLISWNVSRVVTMTYMFYDAAYFNNLVTNWNTGNVTDMSYMFMRATRFNQPVDLWNVTNVRTMQSMFQNAIAFNQQLGNWERIGSTVANVTTLQSMFSGATVFNGVVNSWNLRSVTTTRAMFSQAIAFNQPLNQWNTSNINDMALMFFTATAFNQDISSWNITNVTTLLRFMDSKSYTNYSSANYNALLNAWGNTQSVRLGIVANFGTIRYTNAEPWSLGRDRLINTFSWQLTDGGAV